MEKNVHVFPCSLIEKSTVGLQVFFSMTHGPIKALYATRKNAEIMSLFEEERWNEGRAAVGGAADRRHQNDAIDFKLEQRSPKSEKRDARSSSQPHDRTILAMEPHSGSQDAIIALRDLRRNSHQSGRKQWSDDRFLVRFDCFSFLAEVAEVVGSQWQPIVHVRSFLRGVSRPGSPCWAPLFF